LGQVLTLPSTFNAPLALAYSQGNLYVANFGNGTVSKVAPNGQVNTWTGFDEPAGLALDSQGNLYVANFGNGTVSKVAPDGQVISTWSGFEEPVGLALDAQGNLYVGTASNGQVSKVWLSAPSLTLNQPSMVTNANLTRFTVSGGDSESGDTINLTISDGTATPPVMAETISGFGGAWSVTINLSKNNFQNGPLYYTVTATDPSGQLSASVTQTGVKAT
jgi:sugar lactone lactonase YvrE